MFGAELSDFSLWWLFPILIMILCFLMMRGKKGSMMCGFGSRNKYKNQSSNSGSAMEILDKRFALGEIDEAEYEKKKNTLSRRQ